MSGNQPITPGLAEVLGALTGDRGAFKETHGYDSSHDPHGSKRARYATKVCVGLDKEWGLHLSSLIFKDYGVHGSVYWDRNEWRFETSSAALYKDMHRFYKPEWNARTWRINPSLFGYRAEIRRSFARGYFDADGYPYLSKARSHVYVQVNSVNYFGLSDGKRLLESLGFHPGLYRRYREREVWELTIHRKAELFKFHQEIGFSIKRKQAHLREMLESKWPGLVNEM